jgi:hypothetical protein
METMGALSIRWKAFTTPLSSTMVIDIPKPISSALAKALATISAHLSAVIDCFSNTLLISNYLKLMTQLCQTFLLYDDFSVHH